jgi:hypothetical protein
MSFQEWYALPNGRREAVVTESSSMKEDDQTKRLLERQFEAVAAVACFINVKPGQRKMEPNELANRSLVLDDEDTAARFV